MTRVKSFTTTVSGLVLASIVSCTSKAITDSRTSAKKDKNQGTDEGPGGLETAQDPVLVTATNLTFDGAGARCSAQLSPGSTEIYVISCSAVQITKGSEAVAKTIESGLSIDWQQPAIPNTTGVTIESCATSATKLSQACTVRAPAGVNTVGIEFGLILSKQEANGTKLDTKKDVVSVPWSVQPIGQVVEVPQINANKASDQEQGIISRIIQTVAEFFASFKSLALTPVSKPAIDFPLAGDTQITSCNNKLYLTTRSKIFEMDGNKITHIAGSNKLQNDDNFTNPLRTYWGELTSIGCAGSKLVFSTDNPSAIYRLDLVEWKIEKLLSENIDEPTTSWDGVSNGSQTRLDTPKSITGDKLGNIFYLDMDRVRKIDASGNVSTVFDGTTERAGVYGEALHPALPAATSLALDFNAQGAVRGYFVLVYEPMNGEFRLVTYLDDATKTPRVIAGRADDPGTTNRDNVQATSIVLSSASGISVYPDSAGQPVLLISSANFQGSPGEILQVDATGKTKVLYESTSSMPLGSATYDHALVDAINQVMMFNGQIHAKVSLSSPFETSYTILGIPANGNSQLVAGKTPAINEPYLGSGNTVASLPAIPSSELLLANPASTFSNDGTLYIADNLRKRLYKQLPGENTLKLVASVQAGVLEPVKFSGTVPALAVHKEPSGAERIIYIEEDAARLQIMSLTLGDTSPSVIARSKIPECGMEGGPACQPNNCDLAEAAVPCNPSALALDANGMIYFFDSGSRTVRRIKAPNTFETVAGAGSSTLGILGRQTGNVQKAGNIGFSHRVTGLAFDRIGHLYVTDQGSTNDCPWGGCPVVDESTPSAPNVFLPFIAKIALPTNLNSDLTQVDVTTIVGGGGLATGRKKTNELDLNETIPANTYMPTELISGAILPGGALLFQDLDNMLLAKPSGNSYTVSRFFGGENEACGFSTISGAGAEASLGNALGRICAARVLSVSAYDPCKDSTQSTAAISVNQLLSSNGSGQLYDYGAVNTGVSGSVLKLEMQCNVLPSNL